MVKIPKALMPSPKKDFRQADFVFFNPIPDSLDVEIKLVKRGRVLDETKRFSLSYEDWVNIAKIMKWELPTVVE